MKQIKARTLALSLAVFSGASLAIVSAMNPVQAQSSQVAPNLIAQSYSPVTYLTRFSWDPNQIVMQVSEGEFIFHGYLFSTDGIHFGGEDDQVRVTYDYETERVVVFNKATGDEYYNYFFHDPNLGVGSAPGGSTASHSGSGIQTQRVQFQPGTTSSVVEDSITGYEIVDYVLGAQAGQYMNVSMATDNAASYFNILPPGSNDEAIFIGSTNGNQYEGTLPASGDYKIRVYMMRSAARRDEVANYRLEMIVAD